MVTGPRTWFLFDSEARVEEAVALIVNGGGTLVSLVRQKASLEDLFVKEVAQSDRAERP